MKTKLIFGILFLSLSADYLCQNQELRIFFEEGIPEQNIDERKIQPECFPKTTWNSTITWSHVIEGRSIIY